MEFNENFDLEEYFNVEMMQESLQADRRKKDTHNSLERQRRQKNGCALDTLRTTVKNCRHKDTGKQWSSEMAVVLCAVDYRHQLERLTKEREEMLMLFTQKGGLEKAGPSTAMDTTDGLEKAGPSTTMSTSAFHKAGPSTAVDTTGGLNEIMDRGRHQRQYTRDRPMTFEEAVELFHSFTEEELMMKKEEDLSK